VPKIQEIGGKSDAINFGHLRSELYYLLLTAGTDDLVFKSLLLTHNTARPEIKFV